MVGVEPHNSQWNQELKSENMPAALNDLAPKFLDEKAVALLKQIGVTSIVSLLSLPIERLHGILDFPSFNATCELRQSLIKEFCPAPRSGLEVYQVLIESNCITNSTQNIHETPSQGCARSTISLHWLRSLWCHSWSGTEIWRNLWGCFIFLSKL